MNHEVSAESVVIVGHVMRRRGKSVELVEGAPLPTKRRGRCGSRARSRWHMFSGS